MEKLPERDDSQYRRDTYNSMPQCERCMNDVEEVVTLPGAATRGPISACFDCALEEASLALRNGVPSSANIHAHQAGFVRDALLQLAERFDRVAKAVDVLKVGDSVFWRGDFGSAPPQLARVLAIQETKEPRSKYGEGVESIPWGRMDHCVVDLDNGKWAYGTQLSPAVAR